MYFLRCTDVNTRRRMCEQLLRYGDLTSIEGDPDKQVTQQKPLPAARRTGSWRKQNVQIRNAEKTYGATNAVSANATASACITLLAIRVEEKKGCLIYHSLSFHVGTPWTRDFRDGGAPLAGIPNVLPELRTIFFYRKGFHWWPVKHSSGPWTSAFGIRALV